MDLMKVYAELLEKYGKQGWWPILDESGSDEEKKFEIIIGAILTQNTSWKNVEKAIRNLYKQDLLKPEKILNVDKARLSELIKPAGYYNQKADYLKEVARFFLEKKGEIPTRDELLKIKGIGKETADSILLYAYKKPFFVIDAYTKRLFSNLDLKNYDEWQDFFHSHLPGEQNLFNEFHALIVADGKSGD